MTQPNQCAPAQQPPRFALNRLGDFKVSFPLLHRRRAAVAGR